MRWCKWGSSLNCLFYSATFHSDSLALKVKHHAHNRMHTAEESRNDYAAQLQKYNKEQNFFYYTETPQIFNVRCLHTITRREDAVYLYGDGI